MTARQKIEGLTNSWYGYFFFGALLKLWYGGFGIFNFVWTALSFAFMCLVAFFLKGRLMNRSSLWRFVLVCLTGLFSVLGTVGAAKMGWTFFQTWSFSVLVYTGLLVTSTVMYVRSFRVLTDASVKAYVNG
jgi:hypothetical protein